MAAQSAPLSLYGYGFCMIGAIVMMSVSLGTNYWIKMEYDHESVGHSGLFKKCNLYKCEKYSDPPEFIQVVRAMCLTAMSLYIITLVIIGHFIFIRKLEAKSKNHGWLTMWISFLATVFACVGPSHFIAKIGISSWDWFVNEETWDFGYSLYLSFGSAFFSFWAGVMAIIGVSNLYSLQRPILPMQPFVCAQPAMNVVSPVTYAHPTMQFQFPVQQYPGQQYPGQQYPGQQPLQGYLGQGQAFVPVQAVPSTLPPPVHDQEKQFPN